MVLKVELLITIVATSLLSLPADSQLIQTLFPAHRTQCGHCNSIVPAGLTNNGPGQLRSCQMNCRTGRVATAQPELGQRSLKWTAKHNIHLNKVDWVNEERYMYGIMFTAAAV